jgi:hypothetical protein
VLDEVDITRASTLRIIVENAATETCSFREFYPPDTPDMWIQLTQNERHDFLHSKHPPIPWFPPLTHRCTGGCTVHRTDTHAYSHTHTCRQTHASTCRCTDAGHRRTQYRAQTGIRDANGQTFTFHACAQIYAYPEHAEARTIIAHTCIQTSLIHASSIRMDIHKYDHIETTCTCTQMHKCTPPTSYSSTTHRSPHAADVIYRLV